jgi:hypothetical protein
VGDSSGGDIDVSLPVTRGGSELAAHGKQGVPVVVGVTSASPHDSADMSAARS